MKDKIMAFVGSFIAVLIVAIVSIGLLGLLARVARYLMDGVR